MAQENSSTLTLGSVVAKKRKKSEKDEKEEEEEEDGKGKGKGKEEWIQVLTSEKKTSSLSVQCNFVEPALFDHVKTLVLETRPPIVVFGKRVQQHRNIGFFSDSSLGYFYSGQLMKSQPLTYELKQLMQHVNVHLNTNFNGILVNHYVDGSDYIGAHSDNENALAHNGSVAAISFGASRLFRIRDKVTKRMVIDVPTKHLQLLLMSGSFQKEYTHEIPPQKKILGPRWSLTFRAHTK